jgi:hypothetical protein
VGKKPNDKEISEVGYGKPPVASRFAPGKSGNPKGRPKGCLNLATTVANTLRETVVINENGRRREITKLEAAIKQLVNKAASGDIRALRQLVDLTVLSEQRANDQSPADELSEIDQKTVNNILRRYREGGEEDAND